MSAPPHMAPQLDPASLATLRRRILALRSKTVENGCTQAEALLAAAKIAELLDRHDLTQGAAELQGARCERRDYHSQHNKRLPLDVCVSAVAVFCDCRAWREKQPGGQTLFVFFGLSADVEAAHCLMGVIEVAIRTELGRYKTCAAYQRVRHQDRHVANASFTLGMVTSIADKLIALKGARDETRQDLVVMKASLIGAELQALDVALRSVRRPARTVAPAPFEAGQEAGARLAIEGNGDTS